MKKLKIKKERKYNEQNNKIRPAPSPPPLKIFFKKMNKKEQPVRSNLENVLCGLVILLATT